MRTRNDRLLLNLLFALCLATLTAANSAQADTLAEGFCDCSVSSESDDVICHIPPGNNPNMHTIRVGDPAINAHLAHGDTLGPCPGDEAEYEAYEEPEEHGDEEHENDDSEMLVSEYSCTCGDGSTGSWYHSPEPASVYNLRVIQGQ